MKRSEISHIPEYFDRYINLVNDIDLFEAFSDSIAQLETLDSEILNNIGLKTYAPNKWTINEVFQHITDIERLLCVGTLHFVRDNLDYIISFDEQTIAKNSKANNRDLNLIIEELITVRKATIALYKSFDNDDFKKSGINWKHRISVEAMGFNIIGHQIHHINFIKEHYYTL